MSVRSQLVLQPVAIAQRLAEQFSGVEKDHRHRRIDLRNQMQQHDGLRAERRHRRDAAGKFVLDRRAQQCLRIGAGILRAQDSQAAPSAPRSRCRCPSDRRCAAPAAAPRAWARAKLGRRVRSYVFPLFNQPSRSISASVSLTISLFVRPSSRHCARARSPRATRGAHSGPNNSPRCTPMRRENPGALPPVEAVSNRSPRRTTDGTWKSQCSGTSSALTRAPDSARGPHDVTGIVLRQARNEHHGRAFQVGLHRQTLVERRLRVAGPTVLIDDIERKPLRTRLARELIALLGGIALARQRRCGGLALEGSGEARRPRLDCDITSR